MNRNSLLHGVNTKDNPLFINQVDKSGNSVAVRENTHENEYEIAVNLRSHICVDNTTFDNLSSGGTFVGVWQDIMDYVEIVINIGSDQDSATDGFNIQFSYDASTVLDSEIYTISANKYKKFSASSEMKYFRVNYTNGAAGTSTFFIISRLNRVRSKPSSHRISDSIVSDDDAELNKSVLTALNDNGDFVNIAATKSNNLKVANVENGLAIARGDVVGTSFIHKFGNAPDFDTADGSVAIWDGANDAGIDAMQYTYSTSADIDSISSSNNSDTQNIEIQGLDSNYDTVTQTITLTGQTRAQLTTNLIRVFRLKNIGATDLLGNCYCYVNTALSAGTPIDVTKVRALINNGNNQTLMAIYTIPNGKTGYLREYYASTAGSSKSSQYIIDLYVRPFGQVFQLKNKNSISDVGTSYIQHIYQEPEVFTEKTDIMMKCEMTALGGIEASVSAGFDIVLVDN